MEISEGSPAVHHLVQDASEGPHVGRLANPMPFAVVIRSRVQDGFGGHVIQSPDLSFAVDVLGVVTLNRFGNTEIDQLQRAANEQKISWLQIAVDDPLLVDAVHRTQHLLPGQPDEVHVQRTRRMRRRGDGRRSLVVVAVLLLPVGRVHLHCLLLQHLVEIYLAKLHHEVYRFPCHINLRIVELNDGRVSSQALQERYLIGVSLNRLVVHAVELYFLDREHVALLGQRSVHLAGSSLPDDAKLHVVTPVDGYHVVVAD
mmetsp:Transcript_13725/g.39174  ORF Transcript_13725/g.39174 Transcript_13725/m.39174 type:complete len:258 (+) Transcript_13725:442-1215(+)